MGATAIVEFKRENDKLEIDIPDSITYIRFKN